MEFILLSNNSFLSYNRYKKFPYIIQFNKKKPLRIYTAKRVSFKNDAHLICMMKMTRIQSLSVDPHPLLHSRVTTSTVSKLTVMKLELAGSQITKINNKRITIKKRVTLFLGE